MRRLCQAGKEGIWIMDEKQEVPKTGTFVEAWNETAKEAHATAIEKGWWDGGDRNDGETIALWRHR